MTTAWGRNTRRGRLALGVVSLALVAGGVVGCSSDPGPLQRRAVPPPDPIVESVAADPSASAPSAAPLDVVAFDISTASSITVVVTKRRPLDPVSYEPRGLVTVDGVPGGSDQRMRREAADAMSRMYDAANAAGAPFRLRTAYRSYSFQQGLYGHDARAWGRAEADRRVARPGYSEHQTGLAADVFDVSANALQQSFGESAAGTWIRKHAHEYGYIISYPDGSEAITGYFYEPWHLRYVGTDVSRAMHDAGVDTLQEFMEVEPSPDYG